MTPVGANGTLPPVVPTDATFDGEDRPFRFVEDTRNWYPASAVRPVTTSDVAPAAAWVEKTAQSSSPAARYSTTKPVSSDELSVHDNATLVAVAREADRPEGAAGGMVSDAEALGEEP